MVEVATGPTDSATHEKVRSCPGGQRGVVAWACLQVLSPPLAAHGPEGAQAECLTTGPV